MEASSRAYDRADIYRRTIVQIDHAPANSYLVDIFRVRAEGSRDLVYHGPNSDYQLSGINLLDGHAEQDAKRIRFGLRFHVGGLTDEVFVDDVSIKLSDGTELAVNPSVAVLDEQNGKPIGWNHYTGDGAAEWGASSPGRDDRYCAYIKVKGKPKKWVNQALLQGDTNGYTGINALKIPERSKGNVSFWIRGRAAKCNVGIVMWPTDPRSAIDRRYVVLGSVPVTDHWAQHNCDFSLAKIGMDLENVKSARSPDTWSAVWTLADDMRFSVFHCGQKREVVYVGDGWGQRDWRNSDLGVTIPYIVRRHKPDAGVSAFCTVYEGHQPDAGLVTSVSRLPVSHEHADNAVAVVVQTVLGTDMTISQLKPTEIEIDTPIGKVRTDAALAVLSARQGNASFVSIAKGAKLRLNGRNVRAQSLTADAELPEDRSP